MAISDYQEALKRGRKEFQNCVSRGESPYLSVLEEITSNTEVDAEVYIGQMMVPIKNIVGTNAKGRSTAFARNFMPLLDMGTEFSHKWIALCASHLEEGIRDSIKCYEFMNRYYVVEGNKRVSVLKYFDAVSINAEVTRVVPRYRADVPEIRLYYEYMDFFRTCGVNYIWVTREGSFRKLLELVGREKSSDWNEDAKKEFFSSFTRFEKAYTELGGKRLHSVSTGDAFIKYIEVFGYAQLQSRLHLQIVREVRKLWDELVLMDAPQRVDLVSNPEKTSPANIVERVLGAPNPDRHLKVGFVHDRDKDSSSWTYAHELGRKYLEDVFHGQIQTVTVDNVFDRDQTPGEIMESLVEDGCQVLFATSPRLAKDSIAIAVKHPKVRVLNCAINSQSSHMRSYYGRLYEPKFLSGLIAGSITRTNRIGYVADYPVSGMLANINAFARGARTVNPKARIFLVWSTVKGIDIEKQLYEYGVDLVNNQDMITPGLASRQFGLYQWNEDGTFSNIAMTIVDWGKYYERIIRGILNGNWRDEDSDSRIKAVNYWWGLSAGVVDIMYSKTLPADTVRLVEFMKKMIRTGQFDPFGGQMIDQQGTVRCREDEDLSTEDRVNMDWLLDNVEGTLPVVWEFEDRALPLVQQEDMTLPKVTSPE